MMKTDGAIYSIDKIDISTSIDHHSIDNYLPMAQLKNECRELIVIGIERDSEHQRYYSKLIATAPTKRFFQMLNNNYLCGYAISYIEIAKDIPRESESEAMIDSYKSLNFIMKKSTLKCSIRDYRDSCESTKSANEKGMFSQQTGYWGKDNFQFVLYARYSKITGEPCIHSEWSIRGSGNIKKKAGIRSVKDLCELDLEQRYEQITAEYITTEAINRDKLGKWMNGWSRKKILSRLDQMKVDLAAATLLSSICFRSPRHAINHKNRNCTAAELAEWFKEEKERIRSEEVELTEWDKKILSVQSNSYFSQAVTL